MEYNEKNINAMSVFAVNNTTDEKIRDFTKELLCTMMKCDEEVFNRYVNEYNFYVNEVFKNEKM